MKFKLYLFCFSDNWFASIYQFNSYTQYTIIMQGKVKSNSGPVNKRLQ